MPGGLFIARDPEAETRTRRALDQISSILNSLIRSGTIVQTGPSSWTINNNFSHATPPGPSGVGDESEVMIGRPGVIGVTGATGPMGPLARGEDGEDGWMAPPIVGPTGATGLPGYPLRGEDGEDGWVGSPGVPAINLEVGVWGYNAGTSGTLTLTGGKKVIAITAIAQEAAASFTINGGDTITLPYGSTDKASAALTVEPKGNLVDPTIIFSSTKAYFVEYVS